MDLNAQARGDPVNSASPPESPGRILVVEDDPEAAGYVLHVLRNRGGFDVTHIAGPGGRAGPGPGGTLGSGADRRGDARHDRDRAAGGGPGDSPAAAGGGGHRAPVGGLRGPGAAQQGRRVPGEAGPPGPAGRDRGRAGGQGPGGPGGRPAERAGHRRAPGRRGDRRGGHAGHAPAAGPRGVDPDPEPGRPRRHRGHPGQRVPEGGGGHRRHPVPRGPAGHQHPRGGPDDRRDQPRRRRPCGRP